MILSVGVRHGGAEFGCGCGWDNVSVWLRTLSFGDRYGGAERCCGLKVGCGHDGGEILCVSG